MEYTTIVGINSIACFPEPRNNMEVISYELHVDTSSRSGRHSYRHRDYSFGTGWVLKINYRSISDFAFGGNVYQDAYSSSSNLSELYGICETIRQLKDECSQNFGNVPLRVICDNQKAGCAIVGKKKYLEWEENIEFKYSGKVIRGQLDSISQNYSVQWMKGHQPNDNFENHLADKIAKELRFASEENSPVLGKIHLLSIIQRAVSKTHNYDIFPRPFSNFSHVKSLLGQDNAVILDIHTTNMHADSVYHAYWTIKDSRFGYRGIPILSKKRNASHDVAILVEDLVNVIEAYKNSPFFDPEKTIYVNSDIIKSCIDSLYVSSTSRKDLRKLYFMLFRVTYGLNLIPTGIDVNHDSILVGEAHRVLKTGTRKPIRSKIMKTYNRLHINRNRRK